MWVRDHLDGLWSDEDFPSRYPRDGRPGLSPAQPATVCLLRFLLDLSDRQAAGAVRCRIDFTYALAMNLDAPGLHHSVLTDFRDRPGRDDRDTQALPGIHPRLRDRQPLPAQHLVDGRRISTALLNNSARDHRTRLVGPLKASGAWQKKEQTGFTRNDFTIDFDRRQATCPNGQTSTTWPEAPSMAPCTAARSASSQCHPCPDRPACTRESPPAP
ncbi:transposase [Streptomyces sp. NPDC127166]|uniref:transposase n=1 Tax=Streptomyces sp. NPDC127166 TaxID=3345380 RepID=UPI0036391A06